MTRVIVDADSMVYAAGFAVQKDRYDVTVQRPDGSTDETICWSKDEVNAWLSDEPEGTVSQVDKVVESEPLSHATFLVDRMLNTVDTNLSHKEIEFNRLELFLTGTGNFRDQIATIREYKGNRDPDSKPFHYKSIRRYMVNKWGATVVDGIEADDAVATIMHNGSDVIVVSIDKDLLTVAGQHYNFRTKTLRTVSRQEALANFYRQLVTGDVIDNVAGAYKSGAAAAAKITPHMVEEEMYQYVLSLYQRGKGMKGCPYEHLSAHAALIENARLLHLRRYPGDTWMPPVRDSNGG